MLWDAFPDLKPADAPTYSETDAVYYKAPPPALDAGPDASDAGTSDALVSDAVAPDGWAAGDAGTPDAASDRSPE